LRKDEAVEITLSPDQEALIRQAIKGGRFTRPEEAITEALLLWEEREVLRSEFLASLDDAEASLDRGEGIVVTRESMQALAEDVKQRGRARLGAERQKPG
jgi:Arc/MetJ-type ribon-helix-helix transcriptional regulator